jgi:hypothetical protein
MNALWFDPTFAWVPGVLLGIGGTVFGCFAGFVMSSAERRMKWSALLRSSCWLLLFGSAVLLLLSAVAFEIHQPRSIWFGLLIPGIAGGASFGAALPVIMLNGRKSA